MFSEATIITQVQTEIFGNECENFYFWSLNIVLQRESIVGHTADLLKNI